MDWQAVFRALGDPTRYAIYAHLASSHRLWSTAEMAGALRLHPNTVRPHLERLREVGLVEVHADSQGTVGRPQHRYGVAADAPSLGVEPPALSVLADLLAEVTEQLAIERDGADVLEVAQEVGRRRGLRPRRRDGPSSQRPSSQREAFGNGSGDGAGSSSVPSGRGGSEPVAPCVGTVMAELDELGFGPVVDGPVTPGPASGEAGVATVAFTCCPYRDVATEHPELICRLHRGLVEGMVEATGGAAVRRFATLTDVRPCRVELAIR